MTHRTSRFVPIVIAISVIVGILIGTFFANRYAGNRLNIINTSSNKINDLLHVIDDQYVDTVNIADIVEKAMPRILAELDPHSAYIPADKAKTANDELKGFFGGIGVQFTIKSDTVYVTNIISGGPAEKVGMMPGDRIVSIDDSTYVGKKVTNDETLRRLKGEKGTKVRLGVVRRGEKDLLSFNVVRGDIPIKSIDATYMLTNDLGYIKINKFGETTYPELLISLAQLEQQDFKGLIIDLRDNTGGYMSSAIQMVNEFLPEHKLIVYTQGRNTKREDFYSDGRGSYQKLPLIVLTNENSASAAEIFAGAIQDNDRGIIVGRRTFGKGLVQQQISFSDGSLIHLTISRYYTPSGRCIQKPYSSGDDKEYEFDIIHRYERGEFFNEDSIRQTGETYLTSIGRTVYGGGGIMPDYFVGEDTTEYTSYWQEVISHGLVTQYCFDYTDHNRPKFVGMDNAEDILKTLRKDRVTQQFINYCDNKGVKRRNNMILRSQHLIETALHGIILYNLLDIEEYIEYINKDDQTIKRAIELFNNKQTVPTLPDEKQARDKKVAKANSKSFVYPFKASILRQPTC
ncbi:MAG: S41 family peptidase [Bacteroidaceae bacterium]|nr:S41 family peptidase [Bacteroidaceae bacterium]